MPRDVAAARLWAAEVKSAASARDVEPSGARRFHLRATSDARDASASNGRYATMVTSAGSGYSRWGDMALTRWREDPTCDDYGSYLFIKDVRSGAAGRRASNRAASSRTTMPSRSTRTAPS